jgi:hypothetical protein
MTAGGGMAPVSPLPNSRARPEATRLGMVHHNQRGRDVGQPNNSRLRIFDSGSKTFFPASTPCGVASVSPLRAERVRPRPPDRALHSKSHGEGECPASLRPVNQSRTASLISCSRRE